MRKAIKCVIERSALSDNNGAVITRTHEVENGPQRVDVRRGELTQTDEIRLDHNTLHTLKFDIVRDLRQRLRYVGVAVVTFDERHPWFHSNLHQLCTVSIIARMLSTGVPGCTL